MPTIDVLDATGVTQTVAKVLATGSTTDSGSLPVAFSTEAKAATGALTETAPATDTASSGLNGRLQRVAQRITSLIALLPASLGTKSAATSLAVALSTEDAAKFPASVGSKAAASSFAVTDSTEDIARMGIVTETAPATDTASSGINGRLQRIAQRLTSLLPAGSAAAASSLGVTLSTENVAQIGAVTESAAATDTDNKGLNGLLKRIAQNLTTLNTTLGTSNTQLPATPSGVGWPVITRAANTTAYAAGDIIGGIITIPTGLTSGQNGMLLSADIIGLIASVPSGMTTFRLHLYNASPGSAHADNAPFDLASGDRASYLGFVSIGQIVDYGQSIYAQSDALNRPFDLDASANLYGYLETIGAFTPANNSEVYWLRCHFLGI
jgi:hypothetical protein